MAKFSYDKSNRENASTPFSALPKGAYVCKIIRAIEAPNASGKGTHIEIGFDIAEGDFKDFYKKAFDANTSEDKKWPQDARYYLNVPTDDSKEWQIQQWDTFWTNVEDSNPGYVFDGDGDKLKGKLFGGLFHIEESEYNGNIYSHTRLKWTRAAEDIRKGKYGKLPNDKAVERKTSSDGDGSGNGSDDFMAIPEGVDELIPF